MLPLLFLTILLTPILSSEEPKLFHKTAMANYDEKIYEDALKAAKADEKANLSEEEAEEVAKTFATAYAEVKNLKAAPTDDQKLEVCVLYFYFGFIFSLVLRCSSLLLYGLGLNERRLRRGKNYLKCCLKVS